MEFKLFDNGGVASILVEEEAFSGVRKIADIVSEDICMVTGIKPLVTNEYSRVRLFNCIIVATLDKSSILAQLEKDGVTDFSDIRGKREVYKTMILKNPGLGIENALVIAGSDKRGTIYGMFSLSEYIGVTPLVYFGDAIPAVKSKVVVKEDFLTTSKEPSVKYRGFFINDEWPCFGNWTEKHFGGFNANVYEQVFVFLLRMKGNYLWPAMWSASFPIDGPGSANEELADELGVVMGYSHHEPCLRASEEWDKVRGEGTRYGNEWNYATNREGLLNYWEDALIRSGKYDNIITIGMRGERDTSMLGDDSSVSDNVNLLKDIIMNQKKLIEKHVEPYRHNAPMLLALYKEVERYYYGDENIDGLCNWEGLDDVICMLCEDNFGHMRTLPTKAMRDSGKKFGMYYHLDYHGGPVSYEWVDSTPFSKIWEQMTQAYEFGIKDVWIVNVGDVKFHEVPLYYFLKLAYDYDTWGISDFDSPNRFVTEFVGSAFAECDEKLRKDIEFTLKEYIDINNLRRPESLNDTIYHPCHYNETDRMLERIANLERVADSVYGNLDDSLKIAYMSMIYYSLKASMNNVKLHLYAGKNHHYASQGRKVANNYKLLAEECLKKDEEFIKEFGKFRNGKWDGMQLASHIGFTSWNEDGRKNPVLSTVYPLSKGCMNVSRSDDERVYTKVYGAPLCIEVDDFLTLSAKNVTLEIANVGAADIKYSIQAVDGDLPKWLETDKLTGVVSDLQKITLSVNRDELINECEETYLKITDGDAVVLVHVMASKCSESMRLAGEKEGIVFTANNVISMNAEHYNCLVSSKASEWKAIKNYGKYNSGLKVFPVTPNQNSDAPTAVYAFEVAKDGRYVVEIITTPTNPSAHKTGLSVLASADYGNSFSKISFVDEHFAAGDNRDVMWNVGVLNQERKGLAVFELNKGINTLMIQPVEAGVVLQKILIYKEGNSPKRAYLGQEESHWMN